MGAPQVLVPAKAGTHHSLSLPSCRRKAVSRGGVNGAAVPLRSSWARRRTFPVPVFPGPRSGAPLPLISDPLRPLREPLLKPRDNLPSICSTTASTAWLACGGEFDTATIPTVGLWRRSLTPLRRPRRTTSIRPCPFRSYSSFAVPPLRQSAAHFDVGVPPSTRWSGPVPVEYGLVKVARMVNSSPVA